MLLALYVTLIGSNGASLLSTLATSSVSRPTPSRLIYRLVMAAVLGVFVLALASFASRPAEGASFAVIISPKGGERAVMQLLSQADATLVRQSRYPWIANVVPRSGQTAAQFRLALHQAGALMLLHPALLAGCFTDPSAPRSISNI